MRAITNLIDRITGMTGLVGAWVVAPLIICSCYEVVARYVFGSPTMWAFELGYMLTGANFLLGMAYALREHAHIRIEIFYQFFSPRIQALIDVLTYIVIVIPICAWLSFGLYEYALNAYLSNETSGMSAWNPPIWPFRVTFAVGFLALMLQALAELIRAARIVCTGITHAPARENEILNYPGEQAEAL
ncbi:TRAP transporter small permease subunit [Pseudomonas sp. Q2-TVG4-2]|jgi:TRAP-type mannitol/chloroaromatic compound transport system permease small subunit|uniref:TRAP transporter small permease subunit n=1 Tax=Pseudomonas sp. Q2-TVG4-2 TaxID=1685699 RepID=UPI0015E792A4|nr:TRAP transporter small permease subunit [Pseudomonas sp. Q2-TVG4-2]